jgi:hypothetical protein
MLTTLAVYDITVYPGNFGENRYLEDVSRLLRLEVRKFAAELVGWCRGAALGL